jgi:UDP-N-acetylmuramyl tripeptide synthase
MDLSTTRLFRSRRAAVAAVTLPKTVLDVCALVRAWVAMSAALVIAAIIQALRLGAGMSLPGLVALRIDPTLLSQLTKNRKVIVVSGTNGKTSTAHLIAAVLRTRENVCLNYTGANLLRGIASALILGLRGSTRDGYIVLEADEACCETVVKQCAPIALVITNVGRDQLDRFGEVDRTLSYLRASIHALAPGAIAVLNANDPHVVAMSHGARARIRWYGCTRNSSANPSLWNIDVQACPQCRSELEYQSSCYVCRRCGFGSPQDIFEFDRVSSVSPLRASLDGYALEAPLSGLSGVYNTTAAVAAAVEIGLPLSNAASALRGVAPLIGRGKSMSIDGLPVTILLSKNPSSFTVNLMELTSTSAPQSLIIAVNDRAADGRDVSWLWDVPFERLSAKNVNVVVAGTRAADVALRLKYANVHYSRCVSNVVQAIDSVRHSSNATDIYLCCTYTVLLDLRRARALRAVT